MRLLTASLILVGLCGSGAAQTATPIKHLVVIFDENISFAHYFATYPHALNLSPQSHSSRAPAGGNGGPESRLHRRATRLPCRPDGFLSSIHGHRRGSTGIR